jgi:hypothetical protein
MIHLVPTTTFLESADGQENQVVRFGMGLLFPWLWIVTGG